MAIRPSPRAPSNWEITQNQNRDGSSAAEIKSSISENPRVLLPPLWKFERSGFKQFWRLDGRWTFSFVYSHLTNVTASPQRRKGGNRFSLCYIIPQGPWHSCMPVKVYSRFVYVNFHLHTSDTYSTACLLPLPLNVSLLPGGCTPVAGFGTLLKRRLASSIHHPRLSSLALQHCLLPVLLPSWGSLYHLVLMATAITTFKII